MNNQNWRLFRLGQAGRRDLAHAFGQFFLGEGLLEPFGAGDRQARTSLPHSLSLSSRSVAAPLEEVGWREENDRGRKGWMTFLSLPTSESPSSSTRGGRRPTRRRWPCGPGRCHIQPHDHEPNGFLCGDFAPSRGRETVNASPVELQRPCTRDRKRSEKTVHAVISDFPPVGVPGSGNNSITPSRSVCRGDENVHRQPDPVGLAEDHVLLLFISGRLPLSALPDRRGRRELVSPVDGGCGGSRERRHAQAEKCCGTAANRKHRSEPRPLQSFHRHTPLENSKIRCGDPNQLE